MKVAALFLLMGLSSVLAFVPAPLGVQKQSAVMSRRSRWVPFGRAVMDVGKLERGQER